MKRIVVATKNPGKIREMTAAFRELPVELVALASFGRLPDAVEDGETFAANAEIKARFYMQATGVACLADDSGLEVEALGGAPGVYSARFAGYHADDAANNAKLLSELTRVGRAQSAAAYRCALAFVDTNGRLLLASGSCQGTVKKEPRGVGGFGYDPYFYIEENKTMAELTLQEKDKISHRGNALREMAKLLNVYLSGRN
ncbi:MAG: RdgB/HAM1 family non-canonical purine NTP pyrophosphatase [Negativicutes bacterium]